MNMVELLAPAGSFDALKAAINNGANACYLGGKNFSARAFANNFDENELIEAVKYAHLRNVKIYVTLNTLLTEKEFNNAIKMADFYYRNNVDALLVQDLGLFYYLKSKYPDFELHCSTQMHVHNIQGVVNAKKLGFKRVVLARESSLELIKEACKQGIEIETFVHGAICVSYSGQCLMSSVSKNRSANKGMCAQCCRLKYELFDENDQKIQMDTNYPLSPKDMFLLNDIPELIKAGVTSFKIEGRLKSPAYVGYVTRMYAKAIDSYYKNEQFSLTDDKLNNLKVLFNRNYTNDYLHNKNDLFGQISPNHLGIEIGKVTYNKNGYTYIKLTKQLNQFDGIRIGEFGCICNMLYKDNLLVNKGEINDIIAIKTDQELNGVVYKTLDYCLEKQIAEEKPIKLPLDVKVILKPNNKAIVYINNQQYISDIDVLEAKNAPLNKDSVFNCFNKLNDSPYYINSFEYSDGNAFLPIKMLNEVRRKALDSYQEHVLNSFKRNLIKNEVNYIQPTVDKAGEFVIDDSSNINYVINTESKYLDTGDGIISEFGGLLLPYKDKTAYYTLNCCNSYTYEFLKNLGFNRIILSTELNQLDIDDIKTTYLNRNNVEIKPYTLKQGNRVLMYVKSNPFDKYMVENKRYYIKDYNNKYLIRHNNSITELIEIKDDQNYKNIINKQLFTNI